MKEKEKSVVYFSGLFEWMFKCFFRLESWIIFKDFTKPFNIFKEKGKFFEELKFSSLRKYKIFYKSCNINNKYLCMMLIFDHGEGGEDWKKKKSDDESIIYKNNHC